MNRILFIDDEPINHQLVARALEPLGFQIDFANNGNEGLAKARYPQTRRSDNRCHDARY